MSEQDFDQASEIRIGDLIRAFGDKAVGPSFEPRLVAHEAVVAAASMPWFRRRPFQPFGSRLGVSWAGLLLLIAGLALIAGALLAGATVMNRLPIADDVGGAACLVLDPLAARAGAVDGGGWQGPATASPLRSVARPGLLAGWNNFAPGGGDALDFDIVLFDPATGVERRLTHSDRGFSSQGGYVEWSPDGQAVAFEFNDHHQCSNLYVATADGSRLVRPVRQTQDEFDDWFAWAPDGSALATVHGRPLASSAGSVATGPAQPTRVMSLRLVPRDGSPTVELGSPCDSCDVTNPPIWSPDGALIATTFGRKASGTADTVESVGVAITRTDRVGWTILDEEPARPLGDLFPIGWRDTRTILATRPVDNSNATDVVTISANLPGGPMSPDIALPFGPIAISPDRRFVAGITGAWANDGMPQHEEVEVVDLESGASRTIWASGTAISVDEATWSPDGHALALSVAAYAGGDPSRIGVWTVSADGTGLRRVRTKPMGIAWQPVWQ